MKLRKILALICAILLVLAIIGALVTNAFADEDLELVQEKTETEIQAETTTSVVTLIVFGVLTLGMLGILALVIIYDYKQNKRR